MSVVYELFCLLSTINFVIMMLVLQQILKHEKWIQEKGDEVLTDTEAKRDIRERSPPWHLICPQPLATADFPPQREGTGITFTSKLDGRPVTVQIYNAEIASLILVRDTDETVPK
jgi:hypothetical protein